MFVPGIYLSSRRTSTASPPNQKHTSEVANALLSLLLCDGLKRNLPPGTATNSTAMPEALIGTWRPVTIEYSGPAGPIRQRIRTQGWKVNGLLAPNPFLTRMGSR